MDNFCTFRATFNFTFIALGQFFWTFRATFKVVIKTKNINMKNFKYVFLIVGLIYLAEVVYAFIKPRTSYDIFSFDVPFFAFIIFRLFFGFVFLMLFRNTVNDKG